MILAQLYGPIFYNLILILTIGTALKFNISYERYSNKLINNTKNNYSQAWILAVLLILFLGLRPLSGVFVDTMNYAYSYKTMQNDMFYDWRSGSDLLFSRIMYLFAQLMPVQGFFLFVELIYIGCAFLAIRRFFPNNIWVGFIMYVGAFSFYSYGTNGIRNGAAAAIFLLALSFINKKVIFLTLSIIAIGFHNSLLLPVGAVFMSLIYKNSRVYMIFWLATIPVSLIAGGWFENFFGGLGFDDRLAYITSEADSSLFSSTGFRWDFLLYSCVPIIVGYYVIFKRNITSKYYTFLLNTYVISNAFWILVIQANYSNRFAYLSWFLYPVVLLYPFIHFKLWKNQNNKIALVLFLHFTFSYIMWLLK